MVLDATCTLTMRDSYGDGWNGAVWAAPSFGQSFSLANGFQGTKSFVVKPCINEDKEQDWCNDKLKTSNDNKIRRKCKKDRYKERCTKSCGLCDPDPYRLPSPSLAPPSPSPPLSSPVVMVTTEPLTDAKHTSSNAALIGAGVAALALLAFLYFASRCVPFAPVYIPRVLVGPCLPVLPSSPATANAAIGAEQAVDKGLRQRRRREGIWIGKQLAVNHGEPGTALYHLRLSCQRVDCHRIIRSFSSDKCRQ